MRGGTDRIRAVEVLGANTKCEEQEVVGCKALE